MSNNTSRESFLKGALILSLAGVIVKIMGAFFRIPLSNLIGSIGMGYYQVVYPIYTLFLTLAVAGFPTALAKLVSEQRAVGDFKGANKTFRISYTVLFITGLISFSISARHSFLDLHKPQDKKGKKREAHRQIENSED